MTGLFERTLRKVIPQVIRGSGHRPKGYDPMNPATWSWKQIEAVWGDWRAQVIPEPILRKPKSQLLTVLPASTWTVPDWLAFATEFRGVEEVIRWTLYHIKDYATAGYTTRIFYDESEGSAGAGRADTNMKSIGALPGGEAQVVVSIGLIAIPAAADVFVAPTATQPVGLTEWYNVHTLDAWLELEVSDKLYLLAAPLTMLPPGFGFMPMMGGNSATQLSAGLLANGIPTNNSRYNMDPPITLLPTRPFVVRVRWSAARAVTTAGRFGPALDGWKVRVVA